MAVAVVVIVVVAATDRQRSKFLRKKRKSANESDGDAVKGRNFFFFEFLVCRMDVHRDQLAGWLAGWPIGRTMRMFFVAAAAMHGMAYHARSDRCLIVSIDGPLPAVRNRSRRHQQRLMAGSSLRCL